MTEILISLTDFVDFVLKTGKPKLTKVKEIKKRDKYNPARDYWKKLRDGIKLYHKNKKCREDLDQLLEGISNKKESNYTHAVESYKAFLGRKEIKWFEPPYAEWKSQSLLIRLNPELGLEINGKKYIIKLYFKDDPISQSKVDSILTLLKSTIQPEGSDYSFAILDIQKNKLYTDDKLDCAKLLPLLNGEANSFETIWKSI